MTRRKELETKNKTLIEISQRALDNATSALNIAKEINEDNKRLNEEQKKFGQSSLDMIRLLDSYMERNAQQAQDIIELESVAIAMYDYIWHHVAEVEKELPDDITKLNAYKTIKALFEAEQENEE